MVSFAIFSKDKGTRGPCCPPLFLIYDVYTIADPPTTTFPHTNNTDTVLLVGPHGLHSCVDISNLCCIKKIHRDDL